MKNYLILSLFLTSVILSQPSEGIRWINTNSWKNCIQLYNDSVEVILEPNCGGRILKYSLNGNNVLYVDSTTNGWVWDGNPEHFGPRLHPWGGRFDVGPGGGIIAKHLDLWLGRWDAKILGSRKAKLISKVDRNLNIKVERLFELDSASSKLIYTQTIFNVGSEPTKLFHWSRTFTEGGGICLIPLSKYIRFPKRYLIYGPPDKENINFLPKEEDAIRINNNILEIVDTPHRPKIAPDSDVGWVAYITLDNQLFIKRFPVFENKKYGDIAANPLSVWYYKKMVCEIEPTSPWETIQPDSSYSFTEEWYLYNYKYPDNKRINYIKLNRYLSESNQITFKGE